MLDEPEEESRGGAPEWVVTFADLMSLLLTFFVLMLSFANMEVVKFQTAMGSVQNALGLKSVFELSDVPAGSELLEQMSQREGEGEAEQQIVKELEKILREAGLQDQGSAKIDTRGVVLQLEGDLFFESGEAVISSDSLPVLAALADYTSQQSRFLDVIGHTDDEPIATLVYPSNWELSAARAGQAVRYLSERGVEPHSMRAIGQAHTVPVSDNATQEGRASNRRVEFVFVTELKAPNSADLQNLVPSADSSDSDASNK